jgi:hypothetical protein
MARTHGRAVLAATLISLAVAAAAVPAQGSRLTARGVRPGRHGASAMPASDGAAPVTAVLRATANRIGMGDPDEAPVGVPLNPATYLQLRAEQEAKYRGAPFDLP